jgi:hypothetical protein
MKKEILKKGLTLIHDKLEQDNRKLLYLAVSGSHVWGLDRPDSDIDLRGIYQDPTMKILGLHKGRDTIEFSEGDYDIQLYEVEKFLNMLNKHNGNMVNLLWVPSLLAVIYIPWRQLAQKFMTRKLRSYYRGYAESQRKRAMSQRGGKALIYTYREMFSGLYAMHYGVMEYDFMNLWNEAKRQDWYSSGLLDKYFPYPTQEVTDENWHQFYSEWDDLCIKLDAEAEKSPLPEDFDGVGLCNQILQRLRLMDLEMELR